MPHHATHCDEDLNVTNDSVVTQHQLAKLLAQFVVGTTVAPTQAQVSGAINSVGVKDLWDGIYSAAANNQAVLADPSSVAVEKELEKIRKANNKIIPGVTAAAAVAASLGVAAVTAVTAATGLDKSIASYPALAKALADAVAVDLPTTAFTLDSKVGVATDKTTPLGVAKAARDTGLELKTKFAAFYTEFKAAQPLINATNTAATTAEATIQSGVATNLTTITTAAAATKTLSDSLSNADATSGKLFDLGAAIDAYYVAVDAAYTALTATGVTAENLLKSVGKKNDGTVPSATDGGFVNVAVTGTASWKAVWSVLSGASTEATTGIALYRREAVSAALTISTGVTLADIFAAASVSTSKFVTLIDNVDKAINNFVGSPTVGPADITSSVPGWSVYKMMAATDIDYLKDHPNALSEYLELDQYVNIGIGGNVQFAKSGKKVFASIWDFFTVFYQINFTATTVDSAKTAVVALYTAGYVNWFDAAFWGDLSARMNSSKDLFAAYSAFYVGQGTALAAASIISTISTPTACTFASAVLTNFIAAVVAGAGKAPTLLTQETDLAKLNSTTEVRAQNQILALLEFVENVKNASPAYVLLSGASWQQLLFCNQFIEHIKMYFEPITPQTLANFLGSSVQDASTKQYISQVKRVLSSQALNSSSPESDKYVLFYVADALNFNAEELMSSPYNIQHIITSSTEVANDFDAVYNDVLLTYSLPDRLVLLQKSCNNLSLSKTLLRPSDDFMSVYEAIVLLQEKNKIVKLPQIVQSAEHGYRISAENIKILSTIQFILNNLSGSLTTSSTQQLGALKYNLDQVFSSTAPKAADIIYAVKSVFDLVNGRLASKISTGTFSSVAALNLNDANEFKLIKMLADGHPAKELDVLIALESELRSAGTGNNAASDGAAVNFLKSLLALDMFKVVDNLELIFEYNVSVSAFNNKTPLILLLTNISKFIGGADTLLKYAKLSTTNQANVRKAISLLNTVNLSSFLIGYFQTARSSADVVLSMLSDDTRKQLQYIYEALKAESKPSSVYTYSKFFTGNNMSVRFTAAEIALVFLQGGVSGMEEIFPILPAAQFASNFSVTAAAPNQAADLWFYVRNDEKWVQLLKDVGADAFALVAQLRNVRKYNSKTNMVVLDTQTDAQFVFAPELIAKVFGVHLDDLLEMIGMQNEPMH